jgi:hypothetical protein
MTNSRPLFAVTTTVPDKANRATYSEERFARKGGRGAMALGELLSEY